MSKVTIDVDEYVGRQGLILDQDGCEEMVGGYLQARGSNSERKRKLVVLLELLSLSKERPVLGVPLGNAKLLRSEILFPVGVFLCVDREGKKFSAIFIHMERKFSKIISLRNNTNLSALEIHPDKIRLIVKSKMILLLVETEVFIFTYHTDLEKNAFIVDAEPEVVLGLSSLFHADPVRAFSFSDADLSLCIASPQVVELWDVPAMSMLSRTFLPCPYDHIVYISSQHICGVLSGKVNRIDVFDVHHGANIDTTSAPLLPIYSIDCPYPMAYLSVDFDYIMVGYVYPLFTVHVLSTGKLAYVHNFLEGDFTSLFSARDIGDDFKVLKKYVGEYYGVDIHGDPGLSPQSIHDQPIATAIGPGQGRHRICKAFRYLGWVIVGYQVRPEEANVTVLARRFSGAFEGMKVVKSVKVKGLLSGMSLEKEDCVLKVVSQLDARKYVIRALRMDWMPLKDQVSLTSYLQLHALSLAQKILLCRYRNMDIMANIIIDASLRDLAEEFGPNFCQIHYGLSTMLRLISDQQIMLFVQSPGKLDGFYTYLLIFWQRLKQYLKGNVMKRFVSSVALRSKIEALNSDFYKNYLAFTRAFAVVEASQFTHSIITVSEHPLLLAQPSREHDGGSSPFGVTTDNRSDLLSAEGPHSNDIAIEISLLEPVEPTVPPHVTPLGSKEPLPAVEEERAPISQFRNLSKLGFESLMCAASEVDTDERREGHREWRMMFGNAPVVSWNELIAGLEGTFGVSVTALEGAALSHVLDNSSTGLVMKLKFIEWLKGFGPVQHSVANVARLLVERWFHGYISHKEAESELDGQPDGAFLVRFSKSRPGGFSVAYVYRGEVRQTQLLNTQLEYNVDRGQYKDLEARFYISQGKSTKKYYATVQDMVISFWNRLFSFPLHSPLLEQPWYFGDLTSAEAKEMLLGSAVGTFFIRLSTSRKGSYTLSHVREDGSVMHFPIPGLPGGDPFEVICQVIVQYGHIVRIPLKNTRSALYILKQRLLGKHPETMRSSVEEDSDGDANDYVDLNSLDRLQSSPSS